MPKHKGVGKTDEKTFEQLARDAQQIKDQQGEVLLLLDWCKNAITKIGDGMRQMEGRLQMLEAKEADNDDADDDSGGEEGDDD